jgi:hypothetical protein
VLQNHPRPNLHAPCDGFVAAADAAITPWQSIELKGTYIIAQWALRKRDRWSGLVVMVMGEFLCVRERGMGDE